MKDNSLQIERKRLILSAVIPLVFLIICWLIKLTEISLDIHLGQYSIFPRQWQSLWGILLMPLLHGDIGHLAANSVTFFVLGTGIFYFYRDIALKIWGFSWIFTGLLTWMIGREAYHIGASGVIYAFTGFLFLSGILRNNFRLMAVSLIIVFMYGSMVWGIFPTETNVSWEGHLSGLIVGFVLAYIYRAKGPKREMYSWELESDEEDPTSSSYSDLPYDINYSFRPSDDEIEDQQSDETDIK